MIHLSGRVYFLLLLFGCIFASVLWVCVNQFIRTGSDSRSLPVCLVSCLGLWLRPGLNVCHRLLLATGLWLYPGHYACTRLCFFVACIFLLYFCLYTAKKSTLQSDVKTLTHEERKWVVVAAASRVQTENTWRDVKPPPAVELHWRHTEASLSLSAADWAGSVYVLGSDSPVALFLFVMFKSVYTRCDMNLTVWRINGSIYETDDDHDANYCNDLKTW